MKSLALFALMMSIAASAQVDSPTQEERNEQNQERLDQVPRRDTSAIDPNLRNSDARQLDAKNKREQENTIEKAVERSTGKEIKNPAAQPAIVPGQPRRHVPLPKQ
jgi:hypothetical protein